MSPVGQFLKGLYVFVSLITMFVITWLPTPWLPDWLTWVVVVVLGIFVIAYLIERHRSRQFQRRLAKFLTYESDEPESNPQLGRTPSGTDSQVS